jgi:sugar lactone lactonase YvrE
VQARLDSPQGLAVDVAGTLFVSDRGNHCVRRIDTRTGIITTVAGNGFPGSSGDGGKATSAELRDPVAVAVDRSGSLYIADLGNGRVRRVAPQSRIISTPSGLHDVAAEALAVVPRTGALVAGDAIGSRVLRRDPAGVVTPIAGNGSLGYVGDGGRPLSAHLARPAGLARDVHGNLYVADAGGHRVRRIDLAAGVISTVVGTGRPAFSGDRGAAVTSTLNAPQGLAFDREGRLVIADTGNHRVRRIAADGSIATVAGSGLDGLAQDGQPAISSDIGRPSAVAVDTQGALIVAQGQYGLVHRIDAAGKLRTIVGSRLHVALRDGAPATSGRIERISAFALSPRGDIFFAEEGPSRIWRVDPQTNVAAVVAGRGLGAPVGAPDTASGVTLSWVRALAADTAGNVYIGQYPDGMRRLDAATGRVAALAADARGALRPSALLLDDSALYLAEDAGFVKRLETDGRLVAVAGGGPGF